MRPNEDHFPGACCDWFAVQRWVTVQTDDAAVTWSAVDTPLISLCGMNAGKWLEELPITNGTIFAYALNNYWMTNYKAGQDGPFTFRYSMTSGKTVDPAAAAMFGESVQSPLRVIHADPHPYAAASPVANSFCEVRPSNVEMTALKPADDGHGIIVRIRETAGRHRRRAGAPVPTRDQGAALRPGRAEGAGGHLERPHPCEHSGPKPSRRIGWSEPAASPGDLAGVEDRAIGATEAVAPAVGGRGVVGADAQDWQVPMPQAMTRSMQTCVGTAWSRARRAAAEHRFGAAGVEGHGGYIL